jgi:AsmA protein
MGLAKNAVSHVVGGTSSSDSTQFSSLKGTFIITSGVIHNNDLKLVSPEAPADGAGTIDLPQRSVNYKVTPQLAGLSVPVLVTGPWSNISYRPDLGGMVGNPTKALGAALSGGTGAAKKATGSVGGAFKGMFGH